MLRYILVYGAIPGAVVILTMIAGFTLSGGKAPTASMAIGFLTMALAFTILFIGVKRYRDQVLGGVIKFLPALGLGAAMAAIAGLAYVAIWEVYLAVTGDAFIETYAAAAIEEKRAADLPPEKLEAAIAQIEWMRANYPNPLIRAPITFLEIFPVGLIAALISAAALRNPKVFPARR